MALIMTLKQQCRNLMVVIMANILAILGAGGHGKVVAEAALLSGWHSVVFYDDKWPSCTLVGEWPIVGRIVDFFGSSRNFSGVAIAIGDNSTRRKLVEQCFDKQIPVPTIIHPRACVSSLASVGSGTVVFAGAVINIHAVVGSASIINTNSNIDHDVTIGDFSHVCPGAAIGGNVSVGRLVWIGIGSSIVHNVTIGDNATIGAGSVVINNIPSGQTWVGVPARKSVKDSSSDV